MWLLFDKGTGLINVRLCFWYDFLDTLSCRTAGQLSSHYGCSPPLISSIPPSERRGLDREEKSGRKWHLVLPHLGEQEQKDQLRYLSRTSWWSEAGVATWKRARWAQRAGVSRPALIVCRKYRGELRSPSGHKSAPLTCVLQTAPLSVTVCCKTQPGGVKSGQRVPWNTHTHTQYTSWNIDGPVAYWTQCISFTGHAPLPPCLKWNHTGLWPLSLHLDMMPQKASLLRLLLLPHPLHPPSEIHLTVFRIIPHVLVQQSSSQAKWQTD